MSPLYMVSLPLDLREFRRLAALRGYGRDEGRALHHLLSEAFGKSALKPFRLMAAPKRRSASLYAYARTPEAALRENLDCAAPELLRALGTDHLAVRQMPESWREGRRLAFDVRVRAVRRLLKPLEGWSREGNRLRLQGRPPKEAFGKGREVDAFLVARLRQYPDGPPEVESGELTREAVYMQWLEERLGGAAALDRKATRMAGFSRTTTLRGGNSDDAGISEGPDVTFHGQLTITDSVAFSHLLASGAGRHTAFGYGMLLLRPAGG